MQYNNLFTNDSGWSIYVNICISAIGAKTKVVII